MGSHAHVLLPQSWCVSAAASPMALSFASRLMGGRKAARKEQRSDDADSALQEARTTLIDMGFEAADADRALDSTNGDLAEAVAQLLHIENGSRYSVLAASSSEEAPAADAGEEASVSAEADADIMEAIRRSQEEDEERRRKEVADREMFEAALAASLGEIQEGTPKGIRRTELDQKLEDAKDQLADIREDRRAMNLEDISIMRDHEYFQEEMQWLQRMMAEETEKLQECLRSNHILDRAYRGLEVQTEQLEKNRKALVQEVEQEEADLRKELRQNAEMLTDLQRMRRQQHIDHHGRQEAQMKEQRFRQMQASHAPRSQTATAVSALEDPRERQHSWALHVSAPSDPRTAWVS